MSRRRATPSRQAAPPTHPAAFSEWLRSRSDDQLAALLQARADVAVPPPRNFAQLADRLSSIGSVARATEELDQFAWHVLVLVATVEKASSQRLADLRGLAVADVEQALDRLRALALVWGDDHHARVPGGVHAFFGPDPLDLGAPAARRPRALADLPAVSSQPPALTPRPLGVERADQTGAAAAVELLRWAELLLERWSATPASMTRSGGFPIRELRAAAKVIEAPVDVVALLVEVLAASQLVAVAGGYGGDLMPTERYDSWREDAPADRWRLLAAAWRDMPRLPGLALRSDGGKGSSLLTFEVGERDASRLRQVVLAAHRTVPDGSSVDPAELPGWLLWHRPRLTDDAANDIAQWTVREASAFGVLGGGALTTAGRALLDGDAAVATSALAVALPQPVEKVLIQADLTAVAPGPLRPDLARELAAVADIESSGAATVYRFSEASLRRGFDAGRSAADVHGLLTRLARGGVPQALSYLVDDVARRFGRLRVGAAATYLRCDDPALLAEAAANRRCGPLQLRVLAPTVAVSPLPVAQLVDGLRRAGYLPAAEDSAGGLALAAPKPHRTPVPKRPDYEYAWSYGSPPKLSDVHVSETVRRLRAESDASAPRSGAPAGDSTEIFDLLRDGSRTARRLRIEYADAAGLPFALVAQPLLVGSGHVVVKDGDGAARTLLMSRIRSVVPA